MFNQKVLQFIGKGRNFFPWNIMKSESTATATSVKEDTTVINEESTHVQRQIDTLKEHVKDETKRRGYEQLIRVFGNAKMSTELPDVCKYSKNVWCLLGQNPGFFTLQGSNIYLVGSGSKDRILIDSGQGGSQTFVENVRRLLKEEKTSVTTVILTHWHFDHVGGLKDLIPVFKETNDGKLPCVYKFPTTDGSFGLFPIPSEYPFEELQKGQIFKTEGATLKVHHSPGHTTDSCSIQLLEENALFSGDCLLGEGTGVFEDLYDYLQSLEFMSRLKVSRIYCGHGPVVKNPEASIKYNMNNQLVRERRVLKCFENAEKSLSVSEIVKGIYPVLTSNFSQARINVEHHIKKLLREQKIRIADGQRYVLNRHFTAHD